MIDAAPIPDPMHMLGTVSGSAEGIQGRTK